MVSYVTSKRLVFRREEEGAFLFDPDTGSLYCLNDTGAILYERCREGATFEELLLALTSTYDVEADKAREDLHAFLTDMKERGLLLERR